MPQRILPSLSILARSHYYDQNIESGPHPHEETVDLVLSSTTEDSQAPIIDGKATDYPLHSYPPNTFRGEINCNSHFQTSIQWIDNPCASNRDTKEAGFQGKALNLGSTLFKLLRFDDVLSSLPFLYRKFYVISYQPLPALQRGEPTQPDHLKHSRRHFMITLLLTIAFILVSAPALLGALALLYGGIPPSYADIRNRERTLPQHHWNQNRHTRVGGFVKRGIQGEVQVANRSHATASATMDEEQRYLRFPDHLWGHGLNNVLQEALLYALLAHHSSRSYVFEDFVWSHLPLPYTLYDFTLRPTRIPMSAFIGGWIVGQSDQSLSELDMPQVQLQEPEREKKVSGVDEQYAGHQRRGPLIARVLDFSNWARAQVAFRLLPQHRHWQRQTTSPILNDRPENLTWHAGSRRDAVSKTMDETSLPPTIRSSISAEYFEYVCPPSSRAEIFYTWPESPRPGEQDQTPEANADGTDILNWWIRRLNQEDVRYERCVVVREREKRIWDSDFFGSRRILYLFPILRASPLLREFAWSDLVRDSIDRTIGAFFSKHTDSTPAHPTNSISVKPIQAEGFGTSSNDDGARDRPSAIVLDASVAPDDYSRSSTDRLGAVNHDQINATPSPDDTNADKHDILDGYMHSQVIHGVVAVHLRRGDYKRHCLRLAQWGADYMGWNRLADTSTYRVGPGSGDGGGFEDGLRGYLMHEDNPATSATNSSNNWSTDINFDFDPAGEYEGNNQKDEEPKRTRESYYLAHCLPTVPQIVRRLREVRDEYELSSMTASAASQTSGLDSHSTIWSTTTATMPTAWIVPTGTTGVDDVGPEQYSSSRLREVYVLTNGWPSFVEELRAALLQDGWAKVVGSTDVERGEVPITNEADSNSRRDVLCDNTPLSTEDLAATMRLKGGQCPQNIGLSKEEKGVSAAIDMGLAERAEVFVGNGFSSLSANIVMLRLARGFGVHSNKML